jgi:hexokinase
MSPLTPNNSTIPPASLDVLNGIEKTFTLDDRKLNAIVDQMLHDFSLGLEKYGQSMAMVPTFVSGVPNGQETGWVHSYILIRSYSHASQHSKFLALDLGGTNLYAVV